MSLHLFANFVPPFGTAANNRAETEGNITTIQKLLWQGDTHSTVSAEAIRFAIRRLLAVAEQQGTSRTWNDELRRNEWKAGKDVDAEFAKWIDPKYAGYIDDDLLGFMAAEAGKDEAEGTEADGIDGESQTKKQGTGTKKAKAKGTATTRRSPLEVTRAVSITPWAGDVTFNAASPMATPSAAKKGTENPVPYGTEVHATRYQYGIALTPERLRDKSRAAKAIDALCNLGTVAGNHGRFLFDFSPEAVVIRLTQDPAPRLLYCFDTPDEGKTIHAKKLFDRLASEDILSTELVVGVADIESKLANDLKAKGVPVFGVRKACEEAVKRINAELKIKG